MDLEGGCYGAGREAQRFDRLGFRVWKTKAKSVEGAGLQSGLRTSNKPAERGLGRVGGKPSTPQRPLTV